MSTRTSKTLKKRMKLILNKTIQPILVYSAETITEKEDKELKIAKKKYNKKTTKTSKNFR